jgi:hypothetical protein
MNFSVSNSYVYGLERAVKASGNPMRVVIDTSEANDKDFLRAQKLGSLPQWRRPRQLSQRHHGSARCLRAALLVERGPALSLVRLS